MSKLLLTIALFPVAFFSGVLTIVQLVEIAEFYSDTDITFSHNTPYAHTIFLDVSEADTDYVLQRQLELLRIVRNTSELNEPLRVLVIDRHEELAALIAAREAQTEDSTGAKSERQLAPTPSVSSTVQNSNSDEMAASRIIANPESTTERNQVSVFQPPNWLLFAITCMTFFGTLSAILIAWRKDQREDVRLAQEIEPPERHPPKTDLTRQNRFGNPRRQRSGQKKRSK